MDIQASTLNVVEYCTALRRGEVKVNPKYQRSPRVWPQAAQSFLIETILRGYPIPKLLLHQQTDIRSRRTVKEVVDGQQRTRAIEDFYNDRFRLSTTLELREARGKTLAQLDDELQESFLEYGLNFDVFVATSEREVREVFRRMNSFTVPLNDEEQRHAVFQGPFKWFIQRLGTEYEEPLIQAGIFSERQIIRMADSKLLSEIIHACLNGIKTTSRKALNDLYKSRDDEFHEQADFDDRLRGALERVISWRDIYRTPLVKPYNAYALVLACIHVADPIETLAPDAPGAPLAFLGNERIVENLTALAEQLEADAPDSSFKPFVDAAAERTNVASQRKIRFNWFCQALTGTVPRS